MPLSQTAETGFAASASYDSNRPSYPVEAVDQFLQAVGISDTARASVIDLAAGTGKFTEILATRPENYQITAIEPHTGMREQLIKKSLRDVNVIDGTAEDMSTVKDSSVAALVTAQAFHWFANMNALKEIHRVLQPTGIFGMIWNVEDYNAPRGWTIHAGWETTMRDEMWKLEDGLPRFRNEQWKNVFDEQGRSDPISLHFADPLFGLPIGEASVDTELWLSKQAVLDRFKTYSQVANLEGKQLENFEKTYWDAINDPETQTDDQGRVAVHSKVVWAWASKIPAEPLQSGGRPNQ